MELKLAIDVVGFEAFVMRDCDRIMFAQCGCSNMRSNVVCPPSM